MSFKAVATTSGSNLSNKTYFWTAANFGAGIRLWIYVTADTVATVDGSGYIDDTDYIPQLNVGDLILVFQAGAVADTQSIQSDLAAGITDISLHAVLENTGTVVDLSDDLLGATVTYGD